MVYWLLLAYLMAPLSNDSAYVLIFFFASDMLLNSSELRVIYSILHILNLKSFEVSSWYLQLPHC